MRSSGIRSTRRGFLRAAGAACAAPYVVSSKVLWGQDGPAPSERITTALIGSGSRGQQIIAGGDKVLAVCDVDAKHRAKAKAQIDAMSGNLDCAEYGDFREVLARDDIDAVVVATPDHWHVPIAIAAVKAGKAVYVEKPVSLDIAEGRVLCDVVRRYNAIVQVGSQQRTDEKFIRACELVRNGRIGTLKGAFALIQTRAGKSEPWQPQPVPPELDYDFWLGPAPWSPYHPDRCHYNFRFVTDYSGGDITNWGAHHLDIAQWGIGASESGPIEVEGTGKRNEIGLHDTFYDINVSFLYAGGEKVNLRPLPEGAKGTGGVIFVGSEGRIFVSREKLEAQPETLLDARIGPDEIHLAPESQAGTHMGIWLECIRKKSPKGLNAPVEVGHRSATVCHIANTAMELGRTLKWDPEAEQFIDDDEANRMRRRPMRQPWNL